MSVPQAPGHWPPPAPQRPPAPATNLPATASTLPATAEPSMRELLVDLGSNVERLVRGQIALARAEMDKKGRELKLRAIAVAIGGGVLVAALGCFTAALVALLAEVMATWLAALLVSVLLGIVGYALVMRRPTLSDVVPEQTLESIQKDVEIFTETKP